AAGRASCRNRHVGGPRQLDATFRANPTRPPVSAGAASGVSLSGHRTSQFHPTALTRRNPDGPVSRAPFTHTTMSNVIETRNLSKVYVRDVITTENGRLRLNLFKRKV